MKCTSLDSFCSHVHDKLSYGVKKLDSGYITVVKPLEYVAYYWTETMLRVLKYKEESIVFALHWPTNRIQLQVHGQVLNMAVLSLRRDVETAFLIHLPGFFFFYNFWHVTDELEKIRQRHWKEGLNISKLANLESVTSKACKNN